MNTPRDLRLQALLYLLFLSSLLAGALGLIGELWPHLPISDSPMFTAGGAIPLMLAGVIVFSLMMRWRRVQVLSGTLLLAVAGYRIVQLLQVDPSDLAPLPFGQPARIEFTPAIITLLLGTVGVLGVHGRYRRLLGGLVGCVGVIVGGYVLLGLLIQSDADTGRHLILGYSPVSGMFCFAFGVLLALLCLRDERIRLDIEMPAAVLGALSVLCTFLLLVLAGWGLHLDRTTSARSTAEHHAAMLQHELRASAGLIGRLADRWSALDLQVPSPLVQAELRRYFTDIPALSAMLVLRRNGETLINESNALQEPDWLARQLEKDAVQNWMRSVQARNLAHAWVLPDENNPLHALLLAVPEGEETGFFLARFDIARMLRPDLHLDDHEFGITISPQQPASGAPAGAHHATQPKIQESIAVTIGNGPVLVVTASGGSASVLSLRGALVPCILLFGLLVSYLLVLGRSMAAIQERSSQELSVEEQRFRSLFFQSPDAVFEFSKDGGYLSLNAPAKAITGITDAQLGELSYQALLTPAVMTRADYEIFDRAFKDTISGMPQTFSVGFLNMHGSTRHYECSFVPVVVDQQVSGLYAVVKDMTERLLAQENQRLLTKSLESSDNAVLVLDVRQNAMPAVFVNAAFTRMSGFDKDEILGSAFPTLARGIEGSESADRIQELIENGEAGSLTVKSLKRDGTPYWNQVSLAPVRDDGGVVTHYTAIMKDISNEKDHETRLAYQATHDVLTGLANRFLLEDRLEHDISLAQRNGDQLAVLFIDLDAFKPINDTLGHRVGDEMLISVAGRIQALLRPADTLARFGGDEFVLLLPEIRSASEAQRMADRIVAEVGRPHSVGTHELYVTASIGISFLTEDLDSPAQLLQRADMAMYKAKQQGRDGFVVYSDDLDHRVSARVTLRNELQEALQSGQLFLNYQPQVDQSGRLCGLEALVRWRHPQKGMISPAEFIPVAEETGQIVPLGRWVMRQACADAKALLEQGRLRGRMAVNLSPLQFHRPGFVAAIQEVLGQTGLPASRLELELTEGVLMQNTEGAIEILNELGRMGITASIDDFGTGYSSFSYLKDLPVECVKIDKSFVDSALSQRRDAAVCKGVITMASEMGVKVVAEGVETEAQFELLKGYGCEAFQGYYFAKPMALDDLIAWMEDRG